MPWILGVDTGGTKSEAILADAFGSVHGWGRIDWRHPSSGRGKGGSGRSAQSVSQAVTDAVCGTRIAGELHVSGASRLLTGSSLLNEAVRVVPHGVSEQGAALAIAGEPFGIVVLAGTGAHVSACTPDGRHVLLDGLGPLLGDWGSGFHIGLMAIRQAARASWHPRHATSLAEAVPQALSSALQSDRPVDLVDFMLSNPDRSVIASLAALVDDHARAGDSVARWILAEAADAIAENVRDVVDRLDLDASDLPLIGTGSVAARSSIYWDRVVRMVHSFAPKLRPAAYDLPQAIGHVLAIAEQCGLLVAGSFRETLLSTFHSRSTASAPQTMEASS